MKNGNQFDLIKKKDEYIAFRIIFEKHFNIVS